MAVGRYKLMRPDGTNAGVILLDPAANPGFAVPGRVLVEDDGQAVTNPPFVAGRPPADLMLARLAARLVQKGVITQQESDAFQS